jgi:hypothetical protein
MPHMQQVDPLLQPGAACMLSHKLEGHAVLADIAWFHTAQPVRPCPLLRAARCRVLSCLHDHAPTAAAGWPEAMLQTPAVCQLT